MMKKNNSQYLKGISILVIMLHNFCNNCPGTFHIDCERIFSSVNVYKTVEHLLNGDHLLFTLMAHWGYLAIVPFIFISGYGLVIKYEKNSSNSFFKKNYIWHNAKKLYALFVPIICLSFIKYLIGEIIHDGSLLSAIESFVPGVVLMLTFSGNFFEQYLFVGPWWFFSLTMQLYIIYLLLWECRSICLSTSLALISVIFQWLLLYQNCEELIIWTRWNFIGWLAPFCIGVLQARKEFIPKSMKVSLLFFLLFIFADFYSFTWVLQPVLLVVAISAFDCSITFFNKLFIWIGSISAYLFVLHGFIRNVCVDHFPPMIGLIIYLSVSIIAACVYKKVLDYSSQLFCLVTKKKVL